MPDSNASPLTTMINDLERAVAADAEAIAELRASADRRLDAIENGWAGKDDGAELQREQDAIRRLEQKVAAMEGTLRELRARREQTAARERAAADLDRWQRLYAAGAADADEVLTLTRDIETTFARLQELAERRRAARDRLTGRLVAGIGDERQRTGALVAVQTLFEESRRLEEYIGGNVEVRPIRGSTAETETRLARVLRTFRAALALDDASASPSPTPPSTTEL